MINEETKEYPDGLPPLTPQVNLEFTTTQKKMAEEMAKYESNYLTSGTFDQIQV
jgi:hypothetical protein